MYQTFSKNGSHFQEIVRSSAQFFETFIVVLRLVVEKARDNPSLLLGETKIEPQRKISTQAVAKKEFWTETNPCTSCTQVWQKKVPIDSNGWWLVKCNWYFSGFPSPCDTYILVLRGK